MTGVSFRQGYPMSIIPFTIVADPATEPLLEGLAAGATIPADGTLSSLRRTRQTIASMRVSTSPPDWMRHHLIFIFLPWPTSVVEEDWSTRGNPGLLHKYRDGLYGGEDDWVSRALDDPAEKRSPGMWSGP